MSKDVTLTTPDTTLEELKSQFGAMSGLPVVKSKNDKTLVGVVSKKDLLKRGDVVQDVRFTYASVACSSRRSARHCTARHCTARVAVASLCTHFSCLFESSWLGIFCKLCRALQIMSTPPVASRPDSKVADAACLMLKVRLWRPSCTRCM